MLTGITVTVALMLAVAGVAQAATGSGTIGRTNPRIFYSTGDRRVAPPALG